MDKNIANEILQQSPFGYAYHKIIFDDDGNPQDFLYVDVNKAFFNMVSIEENNIIGKKASEVFPDVNMPYWLDVYTKVESNLQEYEFTFYNEKIDKWIKIRAFSPRKGYYAAIAQDVTQENKHIELLNDQRQRIIELNIELETIFNTTQDAMFLVEVDGQEFRYIRNNLSHQKLTGISLNKMKYKTPVEVLGEENGQVVMKSYIRCVKERKTLTFVETLELPGGKRTWLTSLSPVIEESIVKYIVGSRKDITAEKKAEAEKQEFSNLLKRVFVEHNAVMLMIEPISGKIVQANPAACNFYGYSKKELLDMCIQDINTLSKKEVEELRLKALKEKQRYFIFPHRLKSGEIRLVDVYTCPINYQGEKLLFSIIFDVTDREEYRHQLHSEKELLQTTLFSIGDGVVITDNKGNIILINKVAQEITGYREKYVKGKPFSQVFKLVNDVGEEIESPIKIVLATGEITDIGDNISLVTDNGKRIPIADSAAPIRGKKNEILGVVMVFRDVSQELDQKEKILYLSYNDALTALYNRRFVEEEMLRLDQQEYFPLSIIMGDVNGLKLTNDVFGHQQGDKLLIEVSKALKECCRDQDIIARWGGDEFLIILPQTDEKTTERIVKNIRKCCEQKSQHNLQLSIALGWSVKTKETENIQEKLQEAEEWMYQIKLIEGKGYRKNIINTINTTLLEKSQETNAHTDRVKKMCLRLGEELNLSAKELGELSLLAKLHDIGKIGICEEILKKSSPLTKGEWDEIKKHCEIGYRIAQNLTELTVIAEYILHHHERWDGTGYPTGLKGEEIPLLSRILSVVDAYDVMTNDRIYRDKMSKEHALSELVNNAGTQFDPMIVEKFIHIIETW